MFTSMAKSGAVCSVVFVMVIGLFPFTASGALYFYEDFTTNLPDPPLTGWTYAGPVDTAGASNEYARLHDIFTDDSGRTLPEPYLYYNAVALPGAGQYLYEFDVRYRTSEESYDIFTASLFYTNSPGDFDHTGLGNISDLLLNYSGATGYYNDSNVSRTAVNGWDHISFAFTNPGGYNYVIPFFSLSRDNTEENTSVLVDNVRITGTAPVPEPASAMILGLGLLGLGAVRKRFQK